MNRNKVAFRTLGCRLNQFETDAIMSEFDAAGYQIVNFTDPADVYVVNTCTVTSQSDRKSKRLVSQAGQNAKDPLVIVTGCMVDNYGEKLRDSLSADYYIGNERKTSVFSLAEAHLKGELAGPELYPADVFSYKPAKTTMHTRSLIKIQDGCDNFCTFCIIPFVRGRASSRPAGDIIANIRQVLEFGYKEVVLTGVNIGRYSDGETDFESLVGRILDLETDFRLRISSIEPDGFGDRLIDQFSDPRLMPHLHLCLQSGSDKILLRMRRMYSFGQYVRLIDKFRNRYPGFNVTTDVIVGFPGETEEDFNMTCKAVRDIGFSHVHTFKYSRRKGSRADRMPEQVAEKIKTMRSAVIRELSESNKRRYHASLVGTTQKVLVEKVSGNRGHGYGESYVPVSFEAENLKRNTVREVMLTGTSGPGAEPVLRGKAV